MSRCYSKAICKNKNHESLRGWTYSHVSRFLSTCPKNKKFNKESHAIWHRTVHCTIISLDMWTVYDHTEESDKFGTTA